MNTVFLRFIFGVFAFFLIDRTVDRQEMKLEREGGGGGIGERSASQDLNTGRPKGNGATCRRAAHKAIGTDMNTGFNVFVLDY